MLDRDEMGDVALAVDDGRDGGRFPVQLPVLLAVAEFAVPGASRVDGGPQSLVFGRWRRSRFEDARILAQRLGSRIAGQLQELGIDVLDAALQIGDDDARRALLNCHRKTSQQAVFALQVRDPLLRRGHRLSVALSAHVRAP